MDLIYSKQNIVEASKFVIKKAKTNHYFFEGIVGAGKTTLIKQICFQLGVKETVSSPTFSIINEYLGENQTIYHMDLFRLDDKKEIYNLGILEYLENSNLIIIEWPEILLNNFQYNYTLIKISYINNEKRRITINNIIK
ncbi:MAG: tRNA (adenosine(37)-N6)-threonylcarbamoyltransferase complex ATPase subunit type 1 TsaE [Flavobacteriaceae bacterium]|nr:tRNA (adenosine(37)-N6)-threonylcarbamoyltransferase complex ATPase subunit type 1 TsaE [Flavobacteriaceae bacterium]